MLDKLIDLIIQFIQLFQIYTFVDQYERGVVLRCGKFHRRAEPGLRWILPIGFERIITTNVKPEPMVLGIQSLHTAEGKAVNVQIGFMYEVLDEYVFLIEVESTASALSTMIAGTVAGKVQSLTWDEIRRPEFAKSLRRDLNRRAKKIGCGIREVYMQDCSAGSAKKLWHEGIRINA